MKPSLANIFGSPEKSVRLHRGDYLFHRGESVRMVFTIETGRLRLERSLEDGTPVTLAVLGPGDGVAEAALFADTYHCDARAEVASRLSVYSKTGVLELLDQDADGMGRLVRLLAAQVRRLRAILEVRAVKRADERVLAYLDLLEALGETWDGRPASAVGAELALTPEAVYRALSRLEKTRRIVREGRKLIRKS